jgi:hypothetical protein
MNGAELSGRNDPLTEKIIGVFTRFITNLGLGFWSQCTEMRCGLRLGRLGCGSKPKFQFR